MRKIQISELSIKLFGLFIVCACSFFGGMEYAKMQFVSIGKYSRLKLTAAKNIIKNSLISRGASSRSFSISDVLRQGALTKVAAAIIKRVSVYMVSLFFTNTTKDYPMHRESGSTNSISFSGSSVVADIPVPLHEPLVVIGIDNGVLPLRERNKFYRLVERLYHFVSLNTSLHNVSLKGVLSYSRYSILIFLLFPTFSYAQVAPVPFVRPQYFNNTGQPCVGCRLQTFITGTTTPLVTYKNSAGTIANTNPIILDSAGRADIWLTAGAYRLVLQTAGGSLIWSVDGITSSNIALLGLNNIWTGTNTYNGATVFNNSATFNGGIFSSGPNNLSGGGLLNGSFSGSPSFSGTPNFAGGFLATTGTFSDQITSTLASGTPPFVITSTTLVPNLNVDKLDGCDWATPCALGSTTPNSAVVTTLQANTSFVLNGSTPQVGVQGADTKIISGNPTAPTAGQVACWDANGGVTNTPCNTLPVIKTATSSSICTTGGSTYSTCPNTLTWSGGAFATSAYKATCTGVNANDPRAAILEITSQSTGSLVVTIVTEGSNPITYASISCIGVL